MNLLIDIGNSRLKWAMQRGERIDFGGCLDYRRPEYREEIKQAWKVIGHPRRIAVACVAARQVQSEIADLIQLLWPGSQPLWPKSSARHLGVVNAYARADRLGVDRWLAMIAAHLCYGGKLCVVDCGTAITVDVIDAGGQHQGGLIAAGLVTMKRALLDNAAALTDDGVSPTFSLAADTHQAIANGALLSAVGLIEAVIRRLGDDHRLIVTGGDADAVASALQVKATVDAELVFKGLAAICAAEVA